jgi:DNA polymerase-3 subunit epsilon
MNVLGIDLETTGVDPAKDKIWEFGFEVLNTKTKHVLLSSSGFMKHDGLEIPENIKNLCGITTEEVLNHGRYGSGILTSIDVILDLYDIKFMVAHNCSFEIQFLRELAKEQSSRITEIPWLDTMTDIKYPDRCIGRSLEAVCVYHRVMNLRPHRALTDVQAMMEVFKMYEFDEIKKTYMDLISTPQFVVQAQVSFDDKDLAKKESFRWQEANMKQFPKKWVKVMTEKEIEAAQYPFPVRKLETAKIERHI